MCVCVCICVSVCVLCACVCVCAYMWVCARVCVVCGVCLCRVLLWFVWGFTPLRLQSEFEKLFGCRQTLFTEHLWEIVGTLRFPFCSVPITRPRC